MAEDLTRLVEMNQGNAHRYNHNILIMEELLEESNSFLEIKPA